jgi:hypothetical protein
VQAGDTPIRTPAPILMLRERCAVAISMRPAR